MARPLVVVPSAPIPAVPNNDFVLPSRWEINIRRKVRMGMKGNWVERVLKCAPAVFFFFSRGPLLRAEREARSEFSVV